MKGKFIHIEYFALRDEQGEYLGTLEVSQDLTELRKLSDNQILEIIAPFVPAPLLDKSLSLGYKHWVSKNSDGSYRVYFSNLLAQGIKN